jgi:hypothetical protein
MLSMYGVGLAPLSHSVGEGLGVRGISDYFWRPGFIVPIL